uniref:Cytochrome c-type biogenesis protein CcmF_i n=1 Tax=Euplotes vannus TaxID=5939 RepID=UPI002E799D6E|nr:Cytochrome c-type biogenesis protein CcmF_i [Euplotes vannus]UPM52089.1 Cytochrome c-type biogenesis protein CcmF_i [Euplotes vannus]
MDFFITLSLILTKVVCLLGFFLFPLFMLVFVGTFFTNYIGRYDPLNYKSFCVCLFLPAHTSGIYLFGYLVFFFNWTTPFNDLQLLSFFNTAPTWYLFIICYLIIFYFTYLGLLTFSLIFILFFFAQFFFINSGFCNEWILFCPSTNPLLTNSLNYVHPPIVNSLYVVAFLFLLLSFRYIFLVPTLRIQLLILLCFLRQLPQLLTYLTVALFFGLFWAMQLDTWGGWWVWDPSETLLLQFLGILILVLHKRSSYFLFSWVNLIYWFCFYYVTSWGYVFIYQVPTLHTFITAYSFFLPNYVFYLILLVHFFSLRSWFFPYVKQQPRLVSFSKYFFTLVFIFLSLIYSNWSFFSLLLFYFLTIFTYLYSFRRVAWFYLPHLLVSYFLVYCLFVANSPLFPKILLIKNYWVLKFCCLVSFVSLLDLTVPNLQPVIMDQSISTAFINIEGRLVKALINYRFWA